ncbi:MAG: acetaldehyde dehydrogenase [Chloroflexota bacterium]|nr:acetaldehyde dehydrogenase [Chloroflexota bacterium]
MARIPVAIVGSGNIGTDLMKKLQRSTVLEPVAMVGIDPDSDGLMKARAAGLEATAEGIDWLLANAERLGIRLVFEATSARVHAAAAPRYEALGIIAIDLTPAAVGPAVIPVVNLAEHLDRPNLNLITCGGQATIPMVAAVSRVVAVPYAEIVSTVASRSAGPGTRANIDEFTETTARGLETIGGAAHGKAIIVLNPAEPPILMRNTVYCALPRDADAAAVEASIHAMAAEVAQYVPGYRVKGVSFDDGPFPTPGGAAAGRVSIFLEVTGNGDYLPPYAGNLDIMTAAALRVGETLAERRIVGHSPAASAAAGVPA